MGANAGFDSTGSENVFIGANAMSFQAIKVEVEKGTLDQLFITKTIVLEWVRTTSNLL